MTDLVIYGTPVSPFVRKAEAVLRTQGVAYDIENINIMDMPDWFLEISPARRIPVLRDRSVGSEGVAGTIADSSAICLYLDRKLDAGLYGETAFDAGRVAALEEYADTELAQPLGMKLFRPILFPRFSGQDSDIETAKHTYTEVLPRHFDYLEGMLRIAKRIASFPKTAIQSAKVAVDAALQDPTEVRVAPCLQEGLISRFPRTPGYFIYEC